MNDLESRQLQREQVADLILLDAEGNHLAVCSELTVNDDRSMSFEVMHPIEGSDRYRVTVKIEEI